MATSRLSGPGPGQRSGVPADKAIVVADGDVPAREALDAAWPGWEAGAFLVVAADGGWAKAKALGLSPTVLVGDADSLSEEAFAAAAATPGIEVARSRQDKDESDTELAVLAAFRRGARRVIVLGALGGKRFDHALANVGLLALPSPGQGAVELLDATTRVRLLRGAAAGQDQAELVLDGPPGDVVSLLPFGAAAEGVTTDGLLFPLRGETLPPGPARGLSNVRTSPTARVSLRAGGLLIVETRMDSAPMGAVRSES